MWGNDGGGRVKKGQTKAMGNVRFLAIVENKERKKGRREDGERELAECDQPIGSCSFCHEKLQVRLSWVVGTLRKRATVTDTGALRDCS